MDFAGSVQTSIFAYVLMAVVAMLAAVMVRGIVIVLQRTGQKRRTGDSGIDFRGAGGR